MERLHAAFVIRERDRVQHAGKTVPRAGQVVSQTSNLILKLNVANMDFRIAKQFRHRLPSLLAADDIDDLRAAFLQRLTYLERDAFAIRHAEHEERLAQQPQEITRHYGKTSRLASVTAKFRLTAVLPSHVTLADRKNASPIRSSRAASIRIVSPGRIIRLNLTSVSRPATGMPSPLGCLLSKTAPACIAASQSITPGTIGKFG